MSEQTAGKPQGFDVLRQLAQPFDRRLIKSRKKQNRTLDYVEASTVIDRLNRELGAAWSSELLERIQLEARTKDGPAVVWAVRCRMTATIDGVTTIREAWGGSPGPSPDSIDTLKSAETDALKRAARLLGVALDLYGTSIDEWSEHDEGAGERRGAEPARGGKSQPKGGGRAAAGESRRADGTRDASHPAEKIRLQWVGAINDRIETESKGDVEAAGRMLMQAWYDAHRNAQRDVSPPPDRPAKGAWRALETEALIAIGRELGIAKKRAA